MSLAEPASEPAPREGRVIGLDLGSRRIGVAVTDGDQRLATGVTMIPRHSDAAATYQSIADVVAEYEAVGVVVGLPRSLSGRLGPAALRTVDEVAALRSRLEVPVETVDERFTTVTAAAGLRAGGQPGRRQRALIDQTAAAVLLQAWIDGRPSAGG